MTLLIGEVCAGISAASLAWHPLGWRTAWFAEINPFASRVLAHHHPTVPNHGDFTALVDIVRAGLGPAATRETKRAAWAIARVDVLMGGTPCQDFSVAGLRASLAGDRGNLTLSFIRLADAIDDLRRAAGAAMHGTDDVGERRKPFARRPANDAVEPTTRRRKPLDARSPKQIRTAHHAKALILESSIEQADAGKQR
ncbi:MAG: hypothetical protein RL291_708 [Pseudomonadota bacterium]|jgi:DNA (cytosine-5)-methyltransferase 1